MAVEHQINRRQFMITASVVGGRICAGFVLPSRRVAAATIPQKPWTSPAAGGTEVNAWLIIVSDESVPHSVASRDGRGGF